MPKPKRNQKKITPEEREKINEGIQKKKEQDEEYRISLKEAEIKIFEKAKENLPTLLKERLCEVEKALETELNGYAGLTSTKIHQLISRQTYYSTNGSISYSPKEIMIVFDAYKSVIEIINRKCLFVPSLKNFCAFAGISSNTFMNYLQSPDEDKRNAARMVDDYLSDMLLDAAKMRRTEAAPSIFEAKSVHQMTEAVNPMVIQSGSNINIDSVKSKIAQIRQGHIVEAEYKEIKKEDK